MPHLFLTAVLAAGFAGCRSAQSVSFLRSPVRTVRPVEQSYEEPPYEELLTSPEETASAETDSPITGGQVPVPPLPVPDFESTIRPQHVVTEPVPVTTVTRRATEKVISRDSPEVIEAIESAASTTRITPPFESEAVPLFESQDNTTRIPFDSSLVDLEKSFQNPDSTATKIDPAVVPETISAPSLPLQAGTDQSGVITGLEPDLPLTLPQDDAEVLPLFSDVAGETRSGNRRGENSETGESAANETAPLLPETAPRGSDGATLRADRFLSIPRSPVTVDGSVPFSDVDEATVPEPVSGSSDRPGSAASGDLPLISDKSESGSAGSAETTREQNSLAASADDEQRIGPQFLPETDDVAETDDVGSQRDLDLPEVSDRLTSGDSVAKSGLAESPPLFFELPEITPGPRQPIPPDATLSLPQVEEPFRLPAAVASIVRPGVIPENLPQTSSSLSVQAVEIASFGGRADGIVFDLDGTAYVSHRDSVSTVTLDGEVMHWAKTGGPRGHVILGDGTHLICDVSQRAVLHLDVAGNQIRKVATRSDGHLLRAPNDIVVDRNGGFYFTDPGHARVRNAIGKVHYAAPDGTVRVVVAKLGFPEGIVLSPDGSALFIAESQKNRIVKCEVAESGKVGPPEVFCVLPRPSRTDTDSFVDGLVTDREGWLYVAHRGMSRVEVIGPDGDWRTSFSCPDTIVSNLAFSHDYSRLFVTGSSREMRGRLMIIDFGAHR